MRLKKILKEQTFSQTLQCNYEGLVYDSCTNAYITCFSPRLSSIHPTVFTFSLLDNDFTKNYCIV